MTKENKSSIDKNAKFLLVFLIAFIIGNLLSNYVVQVVKISGESMEPTYHAGNRVIVNHLDKKYDYGDIVISAEPGKENIYIIKRIAGLPNDKLEFKNNSLYINGEKADFYDYEGCLSDQKTVTLSNNEYFLIGDNFEVSYDSRRFGAVDKSYLKGKVVRMEQFRLLIRP
jgi:signal peptidase I